MEGARSDAGVLLSVNNIEVIYDHVILVLKGVSLAVPEGRIVALLGANGAGKTTTLKAISNLLRAERGDVTKGSILYRGEPVERLSPNDLVKRGVIQVMEGRHCFGHLTVEENLLTGAYTRPGGKAVRDELERVYEYFPRLKTRRQSQAGYVSGGEQQMVAIGRALMAKPRMILLDEPSMGLAPQIVEEIFEIVRRLNTQEGVSFLLAEQNTNIALRYADYGYILENGRIVLDGDAATLRAKGGSCSMAMPRPCGPTRMSRSSISASPARVARAIATSSIIRGASAGWREITTRLC
jgi:branched-chain amino acid transport system ATP-binding protein